MVAVLRPDWWVGVDGFLGRAGLERERRVLKRPHHRPTGHPTKVTLKHTDQECPPSSPRPTEFDYSAALSESTALSGLLGPAVAAELGMDSFLSDLQEYQPHDGAPISDLPATASTSITIQPEQWALTYTDPRTPGATTALILPETRHFPSLGLPGVFPSYILPPIEQNLPLFYNTYLTNIEASYATSRAVTMEIDDAIYSPDAACPYPLRTDLGSGFALERLGTTLCKVNNRFTGVYPGDGRRFVIDVGIDWGRWWVGITIVITF
ncbi:uncharacterized protein LOC118427882 [Branchiostoma floridae]|uniref:Uncharacterized protein LOC118427882 n=1 Tax=Branchiostoma floridae TaxID=7739 RepID=A0A9J7M3P8_BRAFL|nr:uncharacterized protein LOC118427882 [Branchiostoma floridae]